MRVSLMVLAAAFLAGCGTDYGFHRTVYRQNVYPVGDGVFEVVIESSQTSSGYWCGASDYARRALGAGWNDRIYVYRGMAEGVVADRRSTVLFTMTPPQGAAPDQPAVSRVNAYRPGQSLTVRSAQSQCSNLVLRF